MATFVLLHGAGSDSWYWHLVSPELRAAGHDVVAVDLPVTDDAAGFAEWWDNTGDAQARDARSSEDASDDPEAVFLHDVPDAVARASAQHISPQSGAVFDAPWPGAGWPAVPTRFLLCRDDRFFPPAFLRRIVRERLGIEPDEMDGGHLPALSRPCELTQPLLRYHGDLVGARR